MIELLAPAGSFESLYAAAENGADAIYLGLKKFSARNFAKNFEIDDIPYIIEYLHSKDKKLYITINTIIKENEIKELFEILENLGKFSIDAIIFQDYSIIKLVKNYFPELTLHASTQLTNINSYDVKFLEPFVKRVILERQLYIDEIENIVKNSNVEIECFIHGALCYSISGQCLFSSYLGGYSGNRGRCTQPCRRLYFVSNKKGYYFSTNDLDSSKVLERLLNTGISSLKIEGRMKSAYYVGNVVKAYRILIDDYLKNRKISEDSIKEAKEYIKESFARKSTLGFYIKPLKEIVEPKLSGNTGLFIGKVIEKSNTKLKFKTLSSLEIYDRIRVQNLREDEKRISFKIKEMFKKSKPVKKIFKNDLVEIPLPKKFEVKKGDLIFKVQSIKTNVKLKDENSVIKIIKKFNPLINVKIDCRFEDERLIFSFKNISIDYQVQYYNAEKSELNSEIILKYFKSKFEKYNLKPEISLKPVKIVIPQKDLKKIGEDLASKIRDFIDNYKIIPESEFENTIKIPEGKNFFFKMKSPADILLFPDNFKDSIILPVHPHIEEIYDKYRKKFEKLKDLILFEIDDLIFEEKLNYYLKKINFLKEKGFYKFYLNSKSELKFFKEDENIFLVTSEKFNISNTLAFEFLKEQGVSKIVLSIENDKTNLEKFFFKLDAIIPLFSYVTVMKSRIPNTIPKSTKIIDHRKKDEFYFKVKKDYFELIHANPFVISYHIEDLYNKGYRNFLFDISGYLKYKNNLKALINNLKKGISPVKGKDFNYSHSLE